MLDSEDPSSPKQEMPYPISFPSSPAPGPFGASTWMKGYLEPNIQGQHPPHAPKGVGTQHWQEPFLLASPAVRTLGSSSELVRYMAM